MRLAAFSPDADAAIASAFEWLRAKRLETVPALVPFKWERPSRKVAAQVRPARTGLAIPERDQEMLRLMADQCGVIERGGMPIRRFDARGVQFQDEVIGVTGWIGQPEWAQGFGMTKAEIQAAVEKAIAGATLGSHQAELIDAMLWEIRQTRENIIAERCPF